MTLSVLILLFSCHGFGGVGTADQDIYDGDEPEKISTTEKKGKTWEDPLKKAQTLIKAYEELDRSQKSFGYRSFQVIFDHIGPVTFVHTGETKGQGSSLGSRLQDTVSGGFRLSSESLRMFSEKAGFFRTHSLKNTGDRNRYEIFQRAGGIVTALRFLAGHSEAYRSHQLAHLYRSDQYRVLKSMKTGFLHLPAETLRFAAAMVLVRLATCFGSSFRDSMRFKPVAKNTDPVCLDELAKMFADKIFYAGFSSFVLASRISTPIMFKVLRKIDPKYGPVSLATARLVIPQISLAIGFIADHIVKTLLQNKDVQQCLLSLTGGGGSRGYSLNLDEDQSPGTITDENGEEFQVYDYHQSVGGASCRRAGQYINSDQFLKEELGVGIVSLVSAAISLSALTAGTSKLVQTSTARMSATLASRITLVLSITTGPVGLIIGTGRMVAFLLLFELISPYVASAHHLNFMESKVDQKAEAFISQSERLLADKDMGQDTQEKLVMNFEKALRSVRGEEPGTGSRTQEFVKAKYHLAKEPGIVSQMNSKKHCAEHYSGHQENGHEALCTAIPMLTEIRSFHDYSKAWRGRKILGQFNMAVSRWKTKLTGFFDNYDSSREQIRYLTRSREIYLTGKSTELDLIKAAHRAFAVRILKEEEGLSSEEAQTVMDHLQGEVIRQEMEPGYVSPVMELEPLAPPYPHPRKMAFDLLRVILDEVLSFELNRTGQYYWGLYGQNHNPDSNEAAHLINQMIEFIDLGPVTINDHFFWPQGRTLPYHVRKELEDLGLPSDLSHYPFLMGTLRRLLTSDVEEDRVYGLILFKNWAPFMYGPTRSFMYPPKDVSMEGKTQRPMGFTLERQGALYESIVKALEFHNPIFKWEYIYLIEATLNSLGRTRKGDSHIQWSQSHHGFDTSELYAYSLTQLICGPESGKGIDFFSEDREGLALRFQFPHLLKADICDNLYQPVRNHDSNSFRPLATRSQFTSPGTLHVGLHQAYIQAPRDEDNPLLFSTEAQAQRWWDENILPESIERLGNMKKAYHQMVAEEFTPHLGSQGVRSDWERFQRAFLPWVDNGMEQKNRDNTSTESLTTSIINELNHYHQAIINLVEISIRSTVDEKLKNLSRCFLTLLDSIPGKKYREAEKQCHDNPGSVIRSVLYQNGSLNQWQVEQLLGLDDRQLLNLESAQRGEFIRNRILVELSQTLGSLYHEIFTYNQMVNDLFDFDLEEKSESQLESENESKNEDGKE